MQIVDKTGGMRVNTPAERESRSALYDHWSLAAAASPSDRSIVWIKDGELWVWHMDERKGRFLPDDGECLTGRIGSRVRDAVMRDGGILELHGENGQMLGYFCG